MNRELEAKNFVSTHSRLKAAGCTVSPLVAEYSGFNTQPPEGGWIAGQVRVVGNFVSTHSRLKAAGFCWFV